MGPRYLIMYAYILMVWGSVDVVLLVNIVPRYVQSVVFVYVVRNMAVLTQGMNLQRFLMLLLDLPMLWWWLCLDILGLFCDRLSSLNMDLRLFP